MEIGLFVFFLFCIMVAVGSIFWTSNRSHDILNQWAQDNGYRIIEAHSPWFAKGPFLWNSNKGQPVYRVVVEDATGRKRSGWIRCGNWMLGVLSDETNVRWDDE